MRGKASGTSRFLKLLLCFSFCVCLMTAAVAYAEDGGGSTGGEGDTGKTTTTVTSSADLVSEGEPKQLTNDQIVSNLLNLFNGTPSGSDGEGDTSGTGGTSGTDETGSETNASYSILNADWKKIDSSDYYTLSFDLQTSSDGEIYSVRIGGLVDINSDSKYRSELAVFLAENFLQQHSAGFTDGDKGMIGAIDADKFSLNAASAGTKGEKRYPLGDVLMGWAATASNMLAYTNWDKNEGPLLEPASTEDGVMTYFIDHYYDQVSDVDVALRWYFNGINENQSLTEDYAADFTDGSLQPSNRAQVRKDSLEGGSSNATHGGNLWSIPVDKVMDSYSIGDPNTDLDEIADALIAAVDDNAGIGMKLLPVGQSVTLSHDVSVFGYIKQKFVQGMDSLKAVFFTDSNQVGPNDINNVDIDDYSQSGKGNEKFRGQNDNIMHMCLVDPIALSNGSETFLIDGYSQSQEYVMTQITTLEQRGTLNPGTGNQAAASNADFVPTELRVTFHGADGYTHEIGQDVTIDLHSTIHNYTLNPLGEDSAITYSYEIYKDGELYDTLTRKNVKLGSLPKVADLIPAYASNGDAILTDSITLHDEGDYSIVLKFDSYTKSSGSTALEDVFKDNNTIKHPWELTVSADGPVEPVEPVEPIDPEDPVDPPYGPVYPDYPDYPVYPTSESAKKDDDKLVLVDGDIYVADYELSKDKDDLKIKFVSDDANFVGLYKGKNLVDLSNYKIMTVKGSSDKYELQLSADYVRSLGEGTHVLRLLLKDNTIIYFVIWVK